MGFLKNHKKTSAQPGLHAENAKPQILQQTEGEKVELLYVGIQHSFPHSLSRGLRKRQETHPRAGGKRKHSEGSQVCQILAGTGFAGRKSPTSRRRRRRSRDNSLSHPCPVTGEVNQAQAGESLVFLVFCKSA